MTSPDMTALLVEDEPLIAWLAIGILQDLGYIVFEARTKHEALAVLGREAGIALLFTDEQLADGSLGSELARQVSNDHPDIRIVITSGCKRPESMPDGAVFVPKPYTERLLASAFGHD